MSDFVHLHCHTEYSLLDGAIRLNDLCARAKDFGQPAAAITDHGNLHGALNFYLAAQKFGVRPIIGCEVYVCHDHSDKTSDLARVRHHLVLLAQNRLGYHNLVKIVSQGALHGFYYRPRVDKDILRRHSEGLVCLSACLAGEVPKALLSGRRDHALAVANEYSSIFPGRFFLELQSNGLEEQSRVNDMLCELAETSGLPLVATNDCHYLNADDVEAHSLLLCIQTQTNIHDEKRMRFETTELYYKSPEEMEKSFSSLPEALSNTTRIATEMCEDYGFDLKTSHFPVYGLPEGRTVEEEFRSLSEEGLKRRLEKMAGPVDEDVYWQRLRLELDMICDMGFPGYFLIVQDFINWAKNKGIPVGPGRGSAAGSLVAYALRITNIDPLPYNLLFERFLNNERVSLPDIDVDFCEERRQEVIRYVSERYGADSVAQITTFGKMMAKAVVRDVGRALGMTFQETDRIAKLIPSDLKMTIKKALEQEPELKALYGADRQIQKLLDVSMRLEGLSRHASVHAAGLVISDKPMVEYLPLYRGKKEDDVVTQFDMKMVEKVGLVKFDFLGLRNMTVIENTLASIRAQGKTPPDLDSLPLDDPDTYKLYAAGDTDGIFQVESSGMRQYLRQLRPTVFEDIIAMLALYRPGPLKMGMVDEFIKRKHGLIEVDCLLDSLENCLKDTYGVIVYQEQVMQIAQIVAGSTLGGADILRRAMGKKDPEAMSKERVKFVEGAQKNGVAVEKAESIFDLMESFAEYGFNKSHSAAYALISYHTAYLKTHYKTEFMAALLSSEMGDQDKLLKYISACRDMGIQVQAPDVQKSRWEFTCDESGIIFGLGGIKNVGHEAVNELVAAREADGPFISMLDFCSRLPLRKMTKRALESLIKGGACDCFGISRAGLLASLDAVVARAQKRNKDKASSQVSLLSLVPEAAAPQLPGVGFECLEAAVPELEGEMLSRFEKEALGFFLTSHPLQPYRREISGSGLIPLEELRDLPPGSTVKCAVLITKCKEHTTKKGDRMAFCDVEDLSASGECVFFPECYADLKRLGLEEPLLLEGQIQQDRAGNGQESEPAEDEDPRARPIKLLAEKVSLLKDACTDSMEPVLVAMSLQDKNGQRLDELKGILVKHKGKAPVHVFLGLEDGMWCRLQLSPKYAVARGPMLNRDLDLWEERRG